MDIYMQIFLFVPAMSMTLNSCIVVHGFINEVTNCWRISQAELCPPKFL